MKRSIAIKSVMISVVISFTAMLYKPVEAGGIPVIDASNLSQNMITTMENVAQTLKQIEEYKTQLEQYQNMLQNTMQPAQFIWDEAQTTIEGLMKAVDTLNKYKQQLGSLDNYLKQFQDMEFYKNSPCFTSAGCSQEEWEKVKAISELASASQKIANDAAFKGLDKQQEALAADAKTLEDLQKNAQGAQGRNDALQYANQFASQQAHQLLQIRVLMIAQHNAVITRLQAQADKEAKQQAAKESFRKNRYAESPDRSWGPSDLKITGKGK
jgi:P-type conjugative transfer protein TrbJ